MDEQREGLLKLSKENLSKISYNSERITELQKNLNYNTDGIDAIKQVVKENTLRVLMMQEKKLDADVYLQKEKDNKDEFDTIKYAMKDNFAQLLATDNYLEKYLPFKI